MVTRFGKKYFNILSKSNFYIFVLTNFHKQFLINLGINSDRIIVNYNPVEINSETQSLKEQKPYFLYPYFLNSIKKRSILNNLQF